MTKKVNIASDFSQKVSELFQSLHGEVKVDIELYEFAVTFLYNPGKFIDSVYVYIDLSSEKLCSDLDFLASEFFFEEFGWILYNYMDKVYLITAPVWEHKYGNMAYYFISHQANIEVFE